MQRSAWMPKGLSLFIPLTESVDGLTLLWAPKQNLELKETSMRFLIRSLALLAILVVPAAISPVLAM